MLVFNPITGQLDFKGAPVDVSGKLDLTGGTVTGQLVLTNSSATGALNVSPVWNNGATTFAGIYGRVTNTASGATSKLIDLGTAAGGSLFSVGTNGMISALGVNGTVVQLQSYGFDCLRIDVNYGVLLSRGNFTSPQANSGMLWLDSGTYAKNGWLTRTSAWTYQFGENHATTATAQTIKAHDVTTGTGADLALKGGTGSVNGGMVKLSNSSNDVRLSVGDDGVGFFSAAPRPQATTFSGGGSHAAGSGTGVTDDSTFDGYTIGQIVAGLRSFGLFA